MAIHVATMVQVQVHNTTGTVKTKEQMTLLEGMNSTTELRVNVDPQIPNTAGYPTLKTYLELEDVSGFHIAHIDQYYVITHA